MIREKTFYRAFFALTLSLALQNLLTFGVNLMDTVMLGRYSQEAMSGVSLCNQIQFLLQMLVGGAGEGAVVLGSQYWGKTSWSPSPTSSAWPCASGRSSPRRCSGRCCWSPTSSWDCCPTMPG